MRCGFTAYCSPLLSKAGTLEQLHSAMLGIFPPPSSAHELPIVARLHGVFQCTHFAHNAVMTPYTVLNAETWPPAASVLPGLKSELAKERG